MEKAVRKTLNANQLKLIAMVAMTVDHVTWAVFPGYRTDWYIILLHIIGRMAAPIFWFFVAEGYHYTHDVKKYTLRLFLFAIISHFAYTFAFGIPFVPFRTTVFNQTSVIWALALGLVSLSIVENPEIKQWQKTILIILIAVIAFCADWSSIAVLAITDIGTNRGNFKKQMTRMMMWVAVYAVVYAVFISPVYGIVQMFTVLTIPLLKIYNGERGKSKNMKCFFYVYYPLHLVICGIIRIALNGNIGVLIGG